MPSFYQLNTLKDKERKESPVAIAVAKVKASRDEVIAAGGNRRMLWMKARLQPNEKPDVETIKVSELSNAPTTPSSYSGDDSIHLRLSVHRYRITSSRSHPSLDT